MYEERLLTNVIWHVGQYSDNRSQRTGALLEIAKYHKASKIMEKQMVGVYKSGYLNKALGKTGSLKTWKNQKKKKRNTGSSWMQA